MMNDPQNIINTVGALAEMAATFYSTLRENGIDNPTAGRLTSVYIRAMIPRQTIEDGKEL